MSNDVKDYERSHYTLLQLLGDVGALYGTLHSLSSALIAYLIRAGDKAQFEILNRVFKRRTQSGNRKLFRTSSIRLRFRDWILSTVC
jgi:hypothetical protein